MDLHREFPHRKECQCEQNSPYRSLSKVRLQMQNYAEVVEAARRLNFDHPATEELNATKRNEVLCRNMRGKNMTATRDSHRTWVQITPALPITPKTSRFRSDKIPRTVRKLETQVQGETHKQDLFPSRKSASSDADSNSCHIPSNISFVTPRKDLSPSKGVLDPIAPPNQVEHRKLCLVEKSFYEEHKSDVVSAAPTVAEFDENDSSLALSQCDGKQSRAPLSVKSLIHQWSSDGKDAKTTPTSVKSLINQWSSSRRSPSHQQRYPATLDSRQ